MSRFSAAFERCKREGRAALMPYITAGDPGLPWTERLIEALLDAGADMIELGVPYSDPLADGPTVQAAGQRALEAGTTIAGIFELIRKVRERRDEPIGLLVYYNCIFRWGEARFVAEAAKSGVDGLIVPDLPPESAASLDSLAASHGIDLIYLVAPTSTRERIRLIAQRGRGFLYCVSLTGVTGARERLSGELLPFLSRVREEMTAMGKDLPLAVGFGISTPEHAAAAGRAAEGVIVGSALIDRFHRAPGPEEGLAECAAFVRELRGALTPGSRAAAPGR